MEIDPGSLRLWLKDSTKENPTLIDCRETEERAICMIEKSELIPLSEFANSLISQGYNPNDHFVVYCHHGIRSLNAVQYMREEGYKNAFSLSGGIDRWAIEIDQGIPRY